MNQVISFTKVSSPFGWLGNMSPHPILYKGKQFRTAEALFQSLRFKDQEIIEKIRDHRSPMGAKFIAKANESNMIIVPKSPEDVRNMKLVINLKIKQHPDLLIALKETGDSFIVEDCTNRPRGRNLFWGSAFQSGKWVGQNVLGNIWMEVRKNI